METDNSPEKNASDIIQQQAREIEALKEVINAKNTEIDIQRIKLKRYGFSLEEAIIFLRKPMLKYNQWLGGENIQLEEIQDSLVNATKASDQKDHKKASSKQPETKNTSKDEMSTLEAVALECMRLALNYLSNAKTYAEDVDNGLIKLEALLPIPRNENESNFLQSKDSPMASDSDFNHRTSLRSSKGSHRQITSNESEHDFEQDIASMSTVSPEKKGMPQIETDCQSCKDLHFKYNELLTKVQKIESEKNIVQEKLAKEIKTKKRIQHAKDVIDQEVEELTSTLFNQANHMVIQESRTRDDLNTKNKELNRKILSLNQKITIQEAEMATLKKALYEFQTRRRSEFAEVGNNENPQEGFSYSIVSGYDEFRTFVAVDGVIFQEFQEHIRACVATASQPPPQATATTLGTQFLKRCIIEDVEPCLYYSYQPNSSFKALGPGMSQATKKKLLENIMKSTCEIKRYVPDTLKTTDNEKRPVEEEKEKPLYALKDKCTACTILRDCEYEIYLGVQDQKKAEQTRICRFCRDRCVAVMDFFKFIAHLRQGFIGPGKSGATILSLFRQISWLRRRMQVAKVGSCSLFETQLSAITGPGEGGEWEKYITILS